MAWENVLIKLRKRHMQVVEAHQIAEWRQSREAKNSPRIRRRATHPKESSQLLGKALSRGKLCKTHQTGQGVTKAETGPAANRQLYDWSNQYGRGRNSNQAVKMQESYGARHDKELWTAYQKNIVKTLQWIVDNWNCPCHVEKSYNHSYKKGKDKKNPNSYRPISLLSCLRKLLEKVINRRLLSFLEDNNVLSQTQTG